MTKQEREFLNDVCDAAENWSYDEEHYHENGGFSVDIEFDWDQWCEDADAMWDALEEVANDWGAGIDSDSNFYYLWVKF